MPPLAAIERFFERLFERPSARLFRTHVQPVQIQRRIERAMETGRPGIWAAGDITTYPGKLKLIATGYSEAAIAVNQAVHWIYPDKKVNPGHSSHMAVFGVKEEAPV